MHNQDKCIMEVIISHITTSNNQQNTDDNQPYTNIRLTNIHNNYPNIQYTKRNEDLDISNTPNTHTEPSHRISRTLSHQKYVK